MSRENVEIMRRFHETFNRRDVDAWLGLMHPDVELVPITARMEGTVYRGHDEIRRWLREFDEDWELFRTTPLEFQDLGDHFLVLGTWDARARTSGVRLDAQPGAWVAAVRDGKITRQETFTNRAEALEALSLSE